MDGADLYHINPATGLPNRCPDVDTCAFGGPEFHYPDKHDAEVAWRARQLERGVIAYRNEMRAKEKQEEEAGLAKLTGNAKGFSKRISKGVFRSIVAKNISKYVVNFMGVLTAYVVASGKWLSEDWIRRLLPTVATIVLVALLGWFGIELFKGSRKAARVVRKRRSAKRATRQAATSRGAPGR